MSAAKSYELDDPISIGAPIPKSNGVRLECDAFLC